MQFYETNMGNHFFNKQLPALTDALRRIAAALERPLPALRLPVDVSPDYISDLFYGNLEPDQEVDSKRIRQLNQEAVELQDRLRSRLSSEDWALTEALQQRLERRVSEETEKAFQTGFRTAMQMVAAGLSVPAKTPENGGRNDD
ncbi:DUF6809 family protein [Hungatella hathewayi]|uniref:DUF6809 family protein n=1 Tax=Hungatella hathewayi TaxID=154046 RepID=UPI0011DCDF76|nr:DUF6809 family protein [Hungatella hathewayi]